MKNVLVIGGAGFVGSNLIESLLRKDVVVTSLDNYFTGSEENHVEGCTYIKGNSADINSLITEKGIFDTVYHLGEYSRVEQSFKDIDVVFELNLNSIYSVLKFCKDNNSKIIYSGSSTKFGDGGMNAYASPYAWCKKTNSDLVKAYCSWFGMDFAITYFYNVYGPKEISNGAYSTVIAKFLDMYNRGARELPVVTPGSQRRNFTHVDDIVAGLLVVGEFGSGDGYGIGSDESFSILEVVDLFGVEPYMIPERPGNRMESPVHNDRLKDLGWVPEKKLAEYISSSMIRHTS